MLGMTRVKISLHSETLPQPSGSERTGQAASVIAELQRTGCRWQPTLTHEARSPRRRRPASSAFKPNYGCEMGLRVEQCDD